MLGMRSAIRAGAAAALVATASCLAGTGDAAFEISVTLQGGAPGVIGGGGQGSGDGEHGDAICTGKSEGTLKRAQVLVLCSVGPYVNITPAPGQDFQGETGEAFRYPVGPKSPMAMQLAMAGGANSRGTVGTVTTLQVSNATGNSSALEMLVSF